MALPTWPALVLPSAPLVAQYDVEHDFAAIRSSMEIGRARQRQRYGDRMQKVKVSWAMTEYQLAYFKSWFVHVAKSGAQFFVIPLRMQGGLADQQARFVGAISYRMLSPTNWVVSAQLEVEAPPVYSAFVVTGIAEVGTAGLINIADTIRGVTLTPAFDAWGIGFAA